MDLSKEYWEKRYTNNETGWDIGTVSTPIAKYVDQLVSKDLKILIPGCGNAHEAVYLMEQGFKQTYILDVVKEPLDKFHYSNPQFPAEQLLQVDFFKHVGKYDLIIEQTFFCALDPSLRVEYVKKMHSLLSKNGKLVGLLFDGDLNENEPPFGGSKEEYFDYFRPYFEFLVFETCYNSIKPRAGRELFMILRKK